jgi:hypothetical protein
MPCTPGFVSRADRRAVSIDASVRLSSGRTLPVTIVDSSDDGCKIRCLHVLPIGEIVQLEITGFPPNTASIRWALPGRAGLRFI